MKLILIATLLFAAMGGGAQNALTPNKDVIERKWLKSQSYQMGWYAVRDTSRFEIGKTTTTITVGKDSVVVVTSVSLKQSPATWIDSTIARTKDLSPVYHSSYNTQRDMVLIFGKVVTGFYRNKIKDSVTSINNTTSGNYFDSNLYPTLITWLPLKESYKKDILIYDFNPNGKTGEIKASITEVKKGIITTKHSGNRDVWILTVSDEIGGAGNSLSTYYIDINDRRLWKQEIKAGSRTMEMVLLEL